MDICKFTKAKKAGSLWKFTLCNRVKFFKQKNMSDGAVAGKLGISKNMVASIMGRPKKKKRRAKAIDLTVEDQCRKRDEIKWNKKYENWRR